MPCRGPLGSVWQPVPRRLLGITAPELSRGTPRAVGREMVWRWTKPWHGCFPAAWRLLCRNRSASDFGIAAAAGKKARNEESHSRPLELPGSPATDNQPRVRPPVSVKAAGECLTSANEAASSASRIPTSSHTAHTPHLLPHSSAQHQHPRHGAQGPSLPPPAHTSYPPSPQPTPTQALTLNSPPLSNLAPRQPPSLSPASAALRNRLPSRLVLPIW